jgi:hypothetical protein
MRQDSELQMIPHYPLGAPRPNFHGRAMCMGWLVTTLLASAAIFGVTVEISLVIMSNLQMYAGAQGHRIAL